jgi:hypothetical protein
MKSIRGFIHGHMPGPIVAATPLPGFDRTPVISIQTEYVWSSRCAPSPFRTVRSVRNPANKGSGACFETVRRIQTLRFRKCSKCPSNGHPNASYASFVSGGARFGASAQTVSQANHGFSLSYVLVAQLSLRSQQAGLDWHRILTGLLPSSGLQLTRPTNQITGNLVLSGTP